MGIEVYERIGVRPVINATGTLTRLGGSLMPPEVVENMVQASKAFVSLKELQEKVGKRLAQLLGVEAAYVSCGCAAGIALATAACMTGKDLAKVNQLPDTTGMKDEVLIPRAHRNLYDRPVRTVGAKLVEFGLPGYTFGWQLEAAINEKTAAIFHLAGGEERALPLKEVCEIAHKFGVPVIVDAAAELPPAENLQKFIREGADIVAFSGGKSLMGPQPSGLVLGRKDIIEAMALHGPPDHGIGRPMKVGKEEMIGLLTAVELYVKRDHKRDVEIWEKRLDCIEVALSIVPGIRCARFRARGAGTTIPRLSVEFNRAALGLTPQQAYDRLLYGEPRVRVVLTREGLSLNPHMLQEGEEEIVARRLVEVLTRAKPADEGIEATVTEHQRELDSLIL